MQLHQKTLGQTKSFFILPDKLKVYVKNSSGKQESYFSYESLNRGASIARQKNSRLLFLAMAMLAFSGCLLLQSLMIDRGIYYAVLPLTFAILSLILYQHKQQNYIIIETNAGQKIVFILNQPNRHALETFLVQLWSYRKQYLREKYFYINYNSDLDRQTLRLCWLLEQNIITKAEYKLAREDWVIDKSCRFH